MQVLVVGGTGTLGRQVVRRALDEGHSVRCLVRNLRRATFLKEWGAELVLGDLCKPATLTEALVGIDAIIDAATARATDSLSIKQVDWQGQVNLIQAAQRSPSPIQRFVFFSILGAQNYPQVPLMDIKTCIEAFLKESGLTYTILQTSGFMQGLIGQYAIPILDNQAVWMTGESTPIAYMDTLDVAKFAVAALTQPDTANQTFPVVGNRAWTGEEIIQLCEKLSGQEAKISKVPLGMLRFMRGLTRCFQWTYNVSDRLAFAEVLASGQPLTTDMMEVYPHFGLDPQEITPLEAYLQEYFGRILKKLKELDYEKNKTPQGKKKKNFFV